MLEESELQMWVFTHRKFTQNAQNLLHTELRCMTFQVFVDADIIARMNSYGVHFL